MHQLRVLGAAALAGAWMPAAAFGGMVSGGFVCLRNGRTTASQRDHEMSHGAAAWHLLSVQCICGGTCIGHAAVSCQMEEMTVTHIVGA